MYREAGQACIGIYIWIMEQTLKGLEEVGRTAVVTPQ